MAGPRDEQAAAPAGRSHLRASHADREQVIETLKAAFVQGRLAKDEFDLRVSQDLRVTDLRGNSHAHRRPPGRADQDQPATPTPPRRRPSR